MPGLDRIDRHSLSQDVFQRLRALILSGEMRPGSPLPSERALGERLGVNRGAVREGLKRLQQSGLVKISHGGPTRVLDYRHSAGMELLPELLSGSDGRIDPAAAEGAIEMRSALAPDVARRVAERAGPELARSLGRILEQMRWTGELPRQQALAFEFWEQLVDASGNLAYRLAFNSLARVYDRAWSLVGPIMAGEVRDTAGLEKLQAALARADGRGAAEAARRHVAIGEAALKRALSAAAPPRERRP
ncbi:MAG TPA: GntR family transcriptional regulator [Gammaproteobacteria bacterium]|nr:GntR family transcriptional regulator [Gammaproteobacteria bacterium]